MFEKNVKHFQYPFQYRHLLLFDSNTGYISVLLLQRDHGRSRLALPWPPPAAYSSCSPHITPGSAGAHFFQSSGFVWRKIASLSMNYALDVLFHLERYEACSTVGYSTINSIEHSSGNAALLTRWKWALSCMIITYDDLCWKSVFLWHEN